MAVLTADRRLPQGWTRSASGVLVSASGLEVTPYLDSPFLAVDRAKRSNTIPAGAVRVTSFASTELTDFFLGTLAYEGMKRAWDSYLSPYRVLDATGQIVLEEGMQGSLDYEHTTRSAGYCRQWEEVDGVGFLCHDTIPDLYPDIQAEVLEGVLTGTSLEFLPYSEPEQLRGKAALVRFVDFGIAGRGICKAPANRGCHFRDLRDYTLTQLRGRSKWVNGIYLPVQTRAADTDEQPQAVAPAEEETAVGLKITQQSGFRIVELRPEADFEEGTLRWGAENLAGVVARTGTLKDELRPNEYDTWGMQALAFNAKSGDAWSEDAIEVFVANADSWSLRIDSPVKSVELPQARGKLGQMLAGMMSMFRGRGDTKQEIEIRARAEGLGASDTTTNEQPDAAPAPEPALPQSTAPGGEDVELKDFQQALEQSEARNKAALDAALRPLLEQRSKEGAAATSDKADGGPSIEDRIKQLETGFNTKIAEIELRHKGELDALKADNAALTSKVAELAGQPLPGAQIPGGTDPGKQKQQRSKTGWGDDDANDPILGALKAARAERGEGR